MINILTLTWGGLDKLERLKNGLYRNLQETGQIYQWYIRDNGSKDRTVEVVQKWPNVQLLSVNHNRDNFAQGVNSLAKLAIANKINDANDVNEDILLLINNDVEFPRPEALVQMLELMKKDVGVVGCRLLYNGTDKLQHAGVIFAEKYGRMPYHYRHQEASDAAAEKNRQFQAVTAAVCMVKTKDFAAIGMMDEKFHWAFEDIDMCLRIGALGKKIVYCGQTKIFHEESGSLKKNPINKLFLGHNVKYFKDKWAGKYEIDHDKYLTDSSYNELS